MTAPAPSGNGTARFPALAAASMPGRKQSSLQWERDGRDWPNSQFSRFIDAGGMRWHVQCMGRGPAILLLHGTGASSHSWRELAPILAKRFSVVAPDLPGHGFSARPEPGMLSLPGMAQSLDSLLRALKLSPELVVGHSAGAAVAAQMCLRHDLAPRWLVSINGALLPLRGIAGLFYTPMARFLAGGGFWAEWLARRAARRQAVERLIERTGSAIAAEGIDLYVRLLSATSHTAAALDMMARWDLNALQRELPNLHPRVLLVVGEKDLMVPPAQAERLRRLLPSAKIKRLADCGHLLHEEQPRQMALLIESLAAAGDSKGDRS